MVVRLYKRISELAVKPKSRALIYYSCFLGCNKQRKTILLMKTILVSCARTRLKKRETAISFTIKLSPKSD